MVATLSMVVHIIRARRQRITFWLWIGCTPRTTSTSTSTSTRARARASTRITLSTRAAVGTIAVGRVYRHTDVIQKQRGAVCLQVKHLARVPIQAKPRRACASKRALTRPEGPSGEGESRRRRLQLRVAILGHN